MAATLTGAEFDSVFRDPDDVGQSEYRAIYDTIVDGVFDGAAPFRKDVIDAEDVQQMLAMLDEFEEWAQSLHKQLKGIVDGNGLEQAPSTT